ncbi:MAG: SDR family oxidoreductase [Campylobacter sp.]|nr:SDR family oxidoreductase [Campylobacter sp.]
MLNLANKKILITGASGNIGRHTAILLSELGAKVIITGRNEKALSQLLQNLHGNGHKSVTLDLNDISKISDFIKDIVEFDGQKLDGLVYSAGIIPTLPIKNSNYEFMNKIMTTNFFAFVEMVRYFSNKKFSNNPSSIVAISSYAAINGDKGQLAYAASKGAMDSATMVMAKELFSKGIRVNTIRPAIVDSGTDELPDRVKQLVDMMQTGRINPKNLAEQIVFLLSDLSSGVYGRCFDVRGYLAC